MDLDMDVNMLLSVVNTKLRNHYESVEDLCKTENIDENELREKLKKAGFTYNAARNQFALTNE